MLMRFLSLFFLVLTFTVNNYSQDLPKNMTDEEKEVYKTYIHPVDERASNVPPVSPVRTMAEWEELDGIIITWTSYQSILRLIVSHAQKEGLVYIVCSDSNTVKNYLSSGSVPLYNLRFLIAPFNSVWVRDYGPWTIYTNSADSIKLVDWKYNRPRPNDDNISVHFANFTGLPLYQTTVSPNDMIHTGGNFMVDGHGTGFSSKLILNENPGKTEAQIDTIMRRFMGIKRFIKMENLPYDGIHHIDMHMKLLDEETLLVGEYPQGVSDGPQIEANLQYVLNNFLTCYGRPFKVVRIPMPPDQFGRWPSGGGYYRTYTNSVIVNKTVIVPTYEEFYDTTALRIYREAMPGYTIVGVNSNSSIPASGAIHCITKEIGVSEPVFISHKYYSGVVEHHDSYEVKAFIKTAQGINNAYLYWSTDTTAGFQSLQMTQAAGDTFVSFIPQQGANTKVFYYISASSNSGRTVVKPLVAPRGTYQFIVDEVIPVELASFNVLVENNLVNLSWKTITETNNSGFTIERASFRKNETTPLQEWEPIGFVEGKGTTSEIQYYTFADENLKSGTYSYRLKQIDFDGTFEYSHEVNIEVSNPVSFVLYQNYPNPFNPVTKIKFSIPGVVNEYNRTMQNVTLIIYNILGKEVATLINEPKEPGTYEIEFNASGLTSGVYFYTLRAGEFSSSKKMTILK